MSMHQGILEHCISLSFFDFMFFTVPQVNDGVILYDQNKPETVGWSASDYFSFTVTSPPAFLPPHTFSILISYQANEHQGNPQHKTRLLNNAGTSALSGLQTSCSWNRWWKFRRATFAVCIVLSGAVVKEGGSVTIDRYKLDASNLLGNVPEFQRKNHHVMYRVISLPQHGALSIQGHHLTRCMVVIKKKRIKLQSQMTKNILPVWKCLPIIMNGLWNIIILQEPTRFLPSHPEQVWHHICPWWLWDNKRQLHF